MSKVSNFILNSHDFGSKNMRTGVIPFGSARGYGLSVNQKNSLRAAHTESGSNELDSNRVIGMADRAKAMIVRLFEDVAKFAQSPSERSNLINALNQGIAFGRERGMQLARSKFEFASQMPIRKETSDIPALQPA
jgi:hypothetical protein